MTSEFYDKLLNAIVRDDVTSYAECESEIFCGNFLFGRFPILSAMYLLRSKKLVRLYEEKYIKINSFTPIDETENEPLVLSDAFRKIAGKCLRLYLDNIVTPLEILLLSGKTARLKRLYPVARPSAAVKQRLSEIYAIKYALSLKCERDEIVMDKRPLTRKEKKKILIAIISAVLAVAIIVSTPFVVNVFYPFIDVPEDKPDENDKTDDKTDIDADDTGDKTDADTDGNDDKTEGKYYFVNDVSEIDFASNNVYTLAADIAMSAETVKSMTCTLKGDGKKITLSGTKPMFETFYGTMENVTIVADVSGKITSDYAVIAKNNYGTIKNVTLNVSGKLTVNGAKATDDSDGVRLAGIAVNNGSPQNRGTINDCLVTANLNLTGTVASDASFSGIAARNYYSVQNCTLEGKIETETVDLAGICDANYYLISECKNTAALTQTSPEQTWSPFVAGINAHNYYVVQNCENSGALTSVSTYNPTDEEQGYPTASVGGIAITTAAGSYYTASVQLYNCKNTGTLTAKTEVANIYVGGIATNCYGLVKQAVNYGAIIAESSRASSDNAVGGIAGYSCGNIVGGYSESTITLNGTFKSGGICGYAKTMTDNNNYLYYGTINQCISESAITITVPDTTEPSFVGGLVGYVDEMLVYEGTALEQYVSNKVLGSYFLGTLNAASSNILYKGSVIGGCDEHIASESYFAKNYVTDKGINGVGAIKNGVLYADGSNAGTTVSTLEEIKAQENYLIIINALQSLLSSTDAEQTA